MRLSSGLRVNFCSEMPETRYDSNGNVLGGIVFITSPCPPTFGLLRICRRSLLLFIPRYRRPWPVSNKVSCIKIDWNWSRPLLNRRLPTTSEIITFEVKEIFSYYVARENAMPDTPKTPTDRSRVALLIHLFYSI